MRLLDAQLKLLRDTDVGVILDIGAQHGDTTLAFYNSFPGAQIYGFEPDPRNIKVLSTKLTPYLDRVELVFKAFGSEDKKTNFHMATHDGAGSLLAFDDTRYAAAPVETLKTIEVDQITLDGFCASHGIDHVDLCQMDVQGVELQVLKGAKGLLSRRRISVLSCEVLFTPIYQNQAYFWDLCAYLYEFGYSLYDIYEKIYHVENPKLLCWADAIFVAPDPLPETVHRAV